MFVFGPYPFLVHVLGSAPVSSSFPAARGPPASNICPLLFNILLRGPHFRQQQRHRRHLLGRWVRTQRHCQFPRGRNAPLHTHNFRTRCRGRRGQAEQHGECQQGTGMNYTMAVYTNTFRDFFCFLLSPMHTNNAYKQHIQTGVSVDTGAHQPQFS